MISFLDYMKELSSNPPLNSGAIFSGNSVNTVIGRFPKQSSSASYYASRAIEDMAQYGLFGFWKCLENEEEVMIDNKPFYKCELYMPDSEEVIGYYYRQINVSGFSGDKLEINNTIYTRSGTDIKTGSTTTYIGFDTNGTIQYGVSATKMSYFEKKQNMLAVFEDGIWGQRGYDSTFQAKVIAYIDLENEKVIWNPNKNGGTWEDFKYVPATDHKCISLDGTLTVSSSNIIVYINVDDEDYRPFQRFLTGTNVYKNIFVADYQHYVNTEETQPLDITTIDVPQKLIEKYNYDYTVKVITAGGGSKTTSTNTLLFTFAPLDKETERGMIQVIYHPDTHNWCEICNMPYWVITHGTDLYFTGLHSEYTNIDINYIDQSVIDLDIYKKMGEIGNGLMLFDDETEDLKYLYDTKNKELYNEYCDLVGTNAITFKK